MKEGQEQWQEKKIYRYTRGGRGQEIKRASFLNRIFVASGNRLSVFLFRSRTHRSDRSKALSLFFERISVKCIVSCIGFFLKRG